MNLAGWRTLTWLWRYWHLLPALDLLCCSCTDRCRRRGSTCRDGGLLDARRSTGSMYNTTTTSMCSVTLPLHTVLYMFSLMYVRTNKVVATFSCETTLPQYVTPKYRLKKIKPGNNIQYMYDLTVYSVQCTDTYSTYTSVTLDCMPFFCAVYLSPLFEKYSQTNSISEILP